MAGGIEVGESLLLVLLPLSFSNEAEGLLGRTPGMGPSVCLRDMVLKAPQPVHILHQWENRALSCS